MVAATSGSYVEKTLSYRRADWLETPSGSATLESFLKQALTKLQTVGHTAVARESGQVLSLRKARDLPAGRHIPSCHRHNAGRGGVGHK